MEKQLFTGQNSFRGLQEAIEAVIQYSSDDDCDIAIIPPEPSALSDEEEDSSYDDSDDEPLASKRKRPNSTRESVLNSVPTWRKCEPSYSSAPQRTSQVNEKKNYVCEELKILNPVQIFEKLLDDDLVDLIVFNSTLYAKQHNRHEFALVPCDLIKFMGILILSGYHKLPREPMYWSLDEDIGVELVSKAMSRHRFRDIKRNLHLVNNDLAGTSNDKMFKIRPLADKLMEKFLQWGVFHDSISVDESIVKYFGHHPAKQFIRGKPVRFGYKKLGCSKFYRLLLFI
ncbi:hypothetical protein HF086_006552 [Spodoptera exigua]|uniref:PiggyBac transposable element-derived protein domain-containing protein n=1 Tax=Spodoptera exigua TaxID=7107 RepID=A0A922SAF7_SPOEX|nr:hypothetical protein HF086_006552 [Spodoptera exigua]